MQRVNLSVSTVWLEDLLRSSLATPRAEIVPLVSVTQFRVRRDATQFLLGRTAGTVEFENVLLGIIVLVKQQIKQHAIKGGTQRWWDLLHALTVLLANTQHSMHPSRARYVETTSTKVILKQRRASKLILVIISQV